jgi:hypothetical protein
METPVLLTLDQWRGVAAGFGLAIAPHSPLSGGGAAASRKPPKGKGWREAIAALAAPDRQVSYIVPAANALKVVSYFGGGKLGDDALVECRLEEGGVRIDFPVSPEAVAEDAREVLLADFPMVPDPFTANLSPAALTSLMAAVDVLRRATLTALLERRVPLDFHFTVSDLQDEVAAGLAGKDARWMVTFLAQLAPLIAPPGPDDLTLGLAELVSAGLVTLERGRWSPTAPLVRLAGYWGSPMPAIAHQAIAFDPAGQMSAWAYRIAIRGAGPLIVLDYQGLLEGAPAVALKSVYGSVYVRELTQMLDDLAATPRAEAAR